MSWTINFMVLMLLTTVTGSILLGIWYWIGQILECAGYINILHQMLYVVILFFLFPLAYLFIYDSYNSDLSGAGSLFLQTPLLLKVSYVFCGVWFLGVCCTGGKYIHELQKLHRRNKTCFPCEIQKREVFDEVCRFLNIKKGKVQLYQNYFVHISEFSGLWIPKVVLPVKEYSEEELWVMYVHELMHYKQRDIWIKTLATVILILHFFNPVVWWFHHLLRRWSEYACDDKASQYTGGMKQYFSVIVQIVANIGRLDSYFITQLVENENELLERMKHMKKIRSYKRRSLKVVIGICMIMIFSSFGMVYAASAGIVAQYESIYDNTVANVQEESNEIEFVEYFDSGVSAGIKVVDMDTESMTRATSSFIWTVEDNTMYRSGTFSASSGGYISIMVDVTPSNKTVNVGIIEPDGTRRYVQNTGYITHKFELDQTGSYRIFVENKSTTTVEVEGTYIVK